MRFRSILSNCTRSCPPLLTRDGGLVSGQWAPVKSDMAAGAMGPPWCLLWRHPFEASKCHETSPSGLIFFFGNKSVSELLILICDCLKTCLPIKQIIRQTQVLWLVVVASGLQLSWQSDWWICVLEAEGTSWQWRGDGGQVPWFPMASVSSGPLPYLFTLFASCLLVLMQEVRRHKWARRFSGDMLQQQWMSKSVLNKHCKHLPCKLQCSLWCAMA